MIKKLALTAVFGAVAITAAPAGATDWSAQVDLCAAAVEAEGLADVNEYDVKFGGAATAKRLDIKLIPNAGGDTLIAQCRIRRGEVTSVKLKA